MDMCININPSVFGFTITCITIVIVIYLIAKAIKE